MHKAYPKAIANAPRLEIDETLFYRAFMELNTCRAFELGPIPYIAIKQYCGDLKLTDEQTESVLFVIRQIDLWYVNYELEKIKAQNKHGQRP